MKQTKERRRHIRYLGQGMVVVIEGQGYPVIDISTSGIHFQGGSFELGAVVPLKLMRLKGKQDSVDGSIIVKAVGTTTRGEFRPTMPLLRFIIRHLSEVTGVRATYFN